MDIAAIISILSSLLKIGLAMYDKMKKMPVEERTKYLVEAEEASSYARKTKDLKKVAEMLGRDL
jgi:hypothetical protein